MIPSISDCIRIMNKYSMLDNIKAHSIVVTKVAYIISYALIKAGENISINKVIAGALLHDIGKTESLRSKDDHTKIGIRICMENGLYEIADIIAEHVILKKFDFYSPCSEKEIIYYSDKRVNHDKVVTLEERMSYIIERYSKGNKKMCNIIKENFKLCKKVEKKLFKKLPFTPKDIHKLVDYVIFDKDAGLIAWQKDINYLK